MTLIQSLTGMVELKITSGSIWNTVNKINEANIPIYSFHFLDELTCTVLVSRLAVNQVLRMSGKNGFCISVTRKPGIFWQLQKVRKRPVLLIGCVICFLFYLLIPTRVLFFQVEGNNRIPDKEILEAVSASGISFGASRRTIRNENVKNRILTAIPEVQWAGINTTGCTAVISVKEKKPAPVPAVSEGISSITAECDGIISTVTATRGNILCSIGQSVKKGEILISGYLDCGLAICATQAEGEVYAKTEHYLTAKTPANYCVRNGKTAIHRHVSVLVGKKRINLWKCSRIWDSSCGRIYKQKYVTLPGGFKLPIAICIDAFYSSELNNLPVDPDNSVSLLHSESDQYLLDHIIAGKVDTCESIFAMDSSTFSLNNHYYCTQMIGKTHWEKADDLYGENDRTNH